MFGWFKRKEQETDNFATLLTIPVLHNSGDDVYETTSTIHAHTIVEVRELIEVHNGRRYSKTLIVRNCAEDVVSTVPYSEILKAWVKTF